ncbi:metallopeptidase family protein [Oceanibium sediminis]|uniref:metallopeptidase family protein n=1 Tax=Oceanibium sediminis TaxID=2026339 RepID=UPI000DD453DA|nr:metallopeptidase family protein [Oceanibium sediminis]
MLPPTLADIETLADQARDSLPEGFLAPAREVVIRVADWPEDELLDEMGIADPFDLTGLYEGVPLTEKSLSDMPGQPDVIWLFRRPLLEEWIEREEVTLAELVTHVLIHEFAHHFGWSDADIAAIDQWWE